MSSYKILGVSMHRVDYNDDHWRVFVAWQSNSRNQRFLWRCTQEIIDHFPTDTDFQETAGYGRDVLDKELVSRLFMFLGIDRLTA